MKVRTYQIAIMVRNAKDIIPPFYYMFKGGQPYWTFITHNNPKVIQQNYANVLPEITEKQY